MSDGSDKECPLCVKYKAKTSKLKQERDLLREELEQILPQFEERGKLIEEL